MTETDISKVLIEGDYATIMGVKYKRVEEPKKPETLYDIIADWWDEIFLNNNEAAETIESLVDRIEKEWLPKEHDTNSYKWNECLKLMRETLR
jgi:hypothetical protein